MTIRVGSYRWKLLSPRQRIELRIERLENGCWQWLGAKSKRTGYGVISVNNRAMLAHRVSYMEFRGPIPKRKQIDHLCRNKACVNPDHLEPVTALVNTRRADGPMLRERRRRLASGVCRNGHPTKIHWSDRHSHCRRCVADKALLKDRARRAAEKSEARTR